MKVVLVDPVSSGVSLAEAFRERGVEPFHLYEQPLAAAYDLDPGLGGKMLHESFEATRRQLMDYGAGAVLAGSEQGVALADQLSAALGLPHNVPELAAARSGKLLEVRVLEMAGIPCARTEPVSDLTEAPEVLAKFSRFPVVVKPVNSAGSDGISICADENAVEKAIGQLLGQRNAVGFINNSVLIQEYLSGPQYFLNTVSADGRHVISDVMLTQYEQWGDKPVQRSYYSLCALDGEERVLVDYGLRCLDALGVRAGASHMELRLTGEGPRLIETNFRMMGPSLPADVYIPAFGHSAPTLWADAVLGRPAFDEYAARPYGLAQALGFVHLRPPRAGGALVAMPGLDEIRRLTTFRGFIKLPRLGVEISDVLLTTSPGGAALFIGPAEPVQRDMAATRELEDNGMLYVTTGTAAYQ